MKQKEVALEKLTHSFFRKENELCNRIGEEEKAMGELNQNNQCFCENKFQRVGNFFFFFHSYGCNYSI